MTTARTSTVPPEVSMALGRLFAMMQRPSQPGDAETYGAIRAIVVDASPPFVDTRPNYAAQRLQGAQGD